LKKAPKFFCDNCGVEVAGNVKACPNCGRFFVSVRCPSCGFSGEERIFARGCPSCGYSMPSGGANRQAPVDPLPRWVYAVAIAALLAVAAVLFAVVLR
jgi:predicted RNA-binding Zn-ribbon protein involved in translation (DUF1610 family)